MLPVCLFGAWTSYIQAEKEHKGALQVEIPVVGKVFLFPAVGGQNCYSLTARKRTPASALKCCGMSSATSGLQVFLS